MKHPPPPPWLIESWFKSHLNILQSATSSHLTNRKYKQNWTLHYCVNVFCYVHLHHFPSLLRIATPSCCRNRTPHNITENMYTKYHKSSPLTKTKSKKMILNPGFKLPSSFCLDKKQRLHINHTIIRFFTHSWTSNTCFT